MQNWVRKNLQIVFHSYTITSYMWTKLNTFKMVLLKALSFVNILIFLVEYLKNNCK